MSNESTPTTTSTGPELHHTALFATLVMQQANMAMIFLGQTPHPQTGQTTTDIQAASVFIDTLEMLAAKTRGNLSKSENDLLHQNLTSLRLAFVAAVDAAPAPTAAPPSPAAPAESAPASQQDAAKPAEPASASEDDLRKKFVKKY